MLKYAAMFRAQSILHEKVREVFEPVCAWLGSRVMKLEALGDAPSFARLKCFVERAELVGVEVVQYQPDTSASG